ncbi:DoxX family protein [Spirosoma montaniterrae]|uniref:DoxX family protein n=1 Tax=Spirosoma montaniterrae TaxID=1178516 RepID=A0A1P9WW92_9BACT|nr:DoxX family protein [Spirosoma montaniterrae]AQG79600.1 hypothetical protein AWR27_09845 [Spirosoma montaniterrae]
MRPSLAVVFLAYTLVRVANDYIPQFGQFLTTKGLFTGALPVWLITAFEIVGGLLALGRCVWWLWLLLINASRGWFVGVCGRGGSEYSVNEKRIRQPPSVKG